jgi:CRP/FNR family transcriptional regulator, polysaccharide utilization system transcription regulator
MSVVAQTPMKSKYAQLNFPFAELLSEDDLKLIYDKSKFVKFKKKEVIIRQGTPVSHIMYIRHGTTKIYKESRNGNYIILKIESMGNFLGILSAFANEVHKHSVSSIDDTEIGFIEMEVFYDILRRNGEYSIKVMTALSNYGLFIFERLLSQSHKQLPGRIADVLLYFSEEIYHSLEFEFPFSRRELAYLAGTTKESFIRTLTEFKNDKIIILDGSKVEIVSMDNVKLLSKHG